MAASMHAMAPSRSTFICLIFYVLVFISNSNSAKLNAPKVLLPYYSSVITNFTLQVEYSPEEAQTASCYQWRSSRPEVAQIQLINSTDGTCSQTALVSAMSKTPHQMTTVVFAENKVSGEILRTNVIVSDIIRVEIETTTRLLYLEDSPEELIIRGYDSEGNVFSNLHGLSFEWNLVSDNETGHDVVDAHNILRITRFTDSHYTTPAHIGPLEEKGLQGDMILVEGIRTGSAKVAAKLRDPAYKAVSPDGVRIVVVANLILTPPDAYVLPLGRVKYKVELLRHNSLKEIKMPSDQYYLDVKDEVICTLNSQTSMATAKIIGSTEVVLKDRNIVAREFFHQPSAVIHVVSPGFLAFVVLPHRKWVLETGREYEIIIEIFDTDSHKMYPSDNVRVVAEFSSAYFDVFFSSVNGTYHRVRTLKKGDTIIDGALVSVIDEYGSEHPVKPELKRSQDVEIYDPVTVYPSRVIFPWDPVSRCVHHYTAQAQGGSGEYVWSASDNTVASVNIRGRISSVGPGKCTITAADARNSAHFSTASLLVLPPADMNFPPSRVEAAVGTVLTLPLSVLAKVDKTMVVFTDCRQLPLNITFSDPTVFKHVGRDEDVPIAIPVTGCTSLNFLASRQGHTEVTVTYRSGKVFLQALITIAAFNPLKPIDPEVETVIALGSSKEVLFRGGPQPWVLDSSRFYQDLLPEKQDMISWKQKDTVSLNRGFHVFVVMCREFSEQEIRLSVGNGITAKNQFPASEEASIRFICSRPVELHLQPALNLNPDLPPCPVTHETHLPTPVHCGKNLDILVTVTDSSGRRFDNISSLSLTWGISPTSLAKLTYLKDLRSDVEVLTEGRKLVSYYQTMSPHGNTGNVVVTVSVNGYKTSVLKSLGKPHEQITPAISKSLELVLVEEAELLPSSVSVFNHPSNQVTLHIKHGSGYFHIQEFESQVLKAKYEQKSKSVVVSPLNDGSQTFPVYDLCLDVDSHPLASLAVSGVGSIQVVVIDKVEVLKEVKAKVQVLDLQGKPLLASFFTLMGLKLEAASKIVTLQSAGQTEDGVTGVYTVYGAVVGHTTLTGSVRLPSGQMIYSAPKPLEVFPPLRLDPKNTTLIIGSLLQILAFGGPQPQSNVEFSIENSHISSITSGGLVEALQLGTTRVIGKAVGVDLITGEKVVYSEDDAVVNVVTLRGIQIHAPLTRLQTDTRMPVYAVGLTEQETPFTFGNTEPPLSFFWSVNSRKILRLQSIYHKSGIQLNPENNFAQQVVAKETGHVTLKLRVRPNTNNGGLSQIFRDSTLTDEVQIQVFERLELINPDICNGQLRITPNTDTFLRSNRDVAAKAVRYTVEGDTSETPVVRLLENNQLRSGPIPGNAVLKVTAMEEFGLNQTLVILVKVKPVSYLMINSDTVIPTRHSSRMATVPVGSTLQFSVSFHDDVGDDFYATNVQLGIRCSRYDLLHADNGVDNNTLVVRASEVGNTILKVWDKRHPNMADYVNIPVGYAISPSEASVPLGSVICFSSPIVSGSGARHGWDSSRLDVMDVREDSGIATAVGIGASTILYSFASATSTTVEVVVEPIRSISVKAGVNFLTNVPSKSGSTFYPVSFGESGNVYGSNCTSKIAKTEYRPDLIPFHCQVTMTQQSADLDVSDLFVASPYFDFSTSSHGCQVKQVAQNYATETIATLDSEVLLVARVSPATGQPEVVSTPMELEFLPSFHIHGSDLHISTASPLASIRVSASAKVIASVQVRVSDDLLLEALSPQRDATSNHMILFPIRLRDSLTLWERDQLDLFVEVLHTRSGQTVKVPVLVKLVGAKPELPVRPAHHHDISWSYLMASTISNYQSWFVLAFIIILTAIAVLVGYHAIIGPRYKTTANSNVFLNQTGIQPSPPSSFIQQSTPVGSPSYTQSYTNRSSPTSPKLWSVSYNQDPSRSPYKRNRYSFSPKS